ncbi:MAG: transporter substrate-binding domain-containing protein [Spirochaetes bacterium]|nr:transporter substrate-binding domain-containing protein [Spirochaetota bacterium]
MKPVAAFIIALILAASPLVGSLPAEGIDDIDFLTEEYPPYNYSKDEKAGGFFVDVLDEALRRLGSSKCVVRNDVGEQLMRTAGHPAHLLETAPDADLNVRLLAAGRLDAIAYDEYASTEVFARNGLDPAVFETVYILRSGELWFAFSRGTSAAAVRSFQFAIDAMRADGRIQALHDRHFR